MTKAFRMRNKTKWGGMGMNLINPVTMDFLSSTLQGPAISRGSAWQDFILLGCLQVRWVMSIHPAGSPMAEKPHVNWAGSFFHSSDQLLFLLWFLLPIPLLPSFSSDVFLTISSDTHLLKVNYLYHAEKQFPLPTLVYVRKSSEHPCYFFTDAQKELRPLKLRSLVGKVRSYLSSCSLPNCK